jgi:hypothetical protein
MHIFTLGSLATFRHWWIIRHAPVDCHLEAADQVASTNGPTLSQSTWRSADPLSLGQILQQGVTLHCKKLYPRSADVHSEWSVYSGISRVPEKREPCGGENNRDTALVLPDFFQQGLFILDLLSCGLVSGGTVSNG